MSKNVVVVSASLRKGSNSDKMADAYVNGAREAGNNVVKISLKDLKWDFCKGCLACYKKLEGHCLLMKDDVDEAVQHLKDADVICFVSPIYYYNLSGQLKGFMDRCNPLLYMENKPWDVYLMMTSEDDSEGTYDTAMASLEAWCRCFTNSRIAGHLYAPKVYKVGDINKTDYIQQAEELGRSC